MKTMSQAVNIEAPKEASASVVAQHAATLQGAAVLGCQRFR